ncbi:MAG: PilZ domain-containing protein, partial [Candidatus Xenobia bacterium]
MGGNAVPEAVREKRASYRLVCTLPASVVISSRLHLTARVCNVSASGLKLVLSEPLRRHAEYTLMLPDAASNQAPFKVRCAWCNEARYESGYEAGCRFLDPSAAVAFLKTHWWLDLAGTVQRRQTIRIVRRYR